MDSTRVEKTQTADKRRMGRRTMTDTGHSDSGRKLLSDPLRNRGSAFSDAERRRLALDGLLPAGVLSQAEQAQRAYAAIVRHPEPLERYRELQALQCANEYLFYRVLIDHLEEFMPIVYTPTVGDATRQYSSIYQGGRGVWLTPAHRGRIAEILGRLAAVRPIRLLVVTDNESILGIGDQGAGGMAIAVGKLALYTAAAGIAPEDCLPVSLDVGTDNERLLADPAYLGLRQPRLRGPAYAELIAEFVAAVESTLPSALVQWEDFRKDKALEILGLYRERLPSFNDDIQGTGAVALAGIFSALRVTGGTLAEQRIVVFGAGAAGLGISRQIRAALVHAGISDAAARAQVAVLDSRGLLVDDREFDDDYKRDLAWPADAAETRGLTGSSDLHAVVAAFRPTVLIGTSGRAGAFSEALVRELAAVVPRPVILPLSNPTANSEATPQDLLAWTNGAVLVATGSPFDPVDVDGRQVLVGQGNNVFIFPALGLATLLCGARVVTDGMITASAKALASQVTRRELESGLLYPATSRLREVTATVAAAVIDQAVAEGSATESVTDARALVWASAWEPDYPELH